MVGEILPLAIFPEGGLAGSVITTVWVGVFVVSFFNLRYGWVMSGLVVPGYLVPIIILKPWSAGLIVFEAVLTYLVVHLFSERASRFRLWSSLFGRDRFFALILISVMVRIAFDGAFIPALDGWLQAIGAPDLSLRNELQSFGLVIIALTANQLWKPGLVRGLLTLVVCTFITWLLVRFVLMELTNFSISSIAFMYEDAAQSILASPKSYIVLLTTAFVASRFNLLYGWDFNGILLPSLLALQWYQPGKILFTFLEAFVILAIARQLIRVPWVARLNIEGARKILLLFNISFLYRYAMGWAVPLVYPDLKVTDTYGFGYLLSTLLAVKMFDKGAPIHLTRATLQASATAVLVASLIGYSLKWIGWHRPTAQTVGIPGHTDPKRLEISLDKRLHSDTVIYYQARARAEMPTPWPAEIQVFRDAVTRLMESPPDDDTTLRQAAAELGRIGFDIETENGSVLYIREQPPARGWGSYLINRGAPSNLVVEWPRASDERIRPDFARVLMQLTSARALAIATARSRQNPDGSSDMLVHSEAMFHAFRRGLTHPEVLQVRVRPPSKIDTAELWIKRHLPTGIALSQLETIFPGLKVMWGQPGYENVAREAVPDHLAELLISRPQLRRVVASRVNLDAAMPVRQISNRVDGFLAAWLFAEPRRFSQPGSGAYRPPSVDELLYLDLEVLSPLLAIAPQWSLSANRSAALGELNQAAATLGYEVSILRQTGTGEEFAILSERERAPEEAYRHWGVLVVRLGPSQPVMINVPYPQTESGSAEFGVLEFERLRARAFAMATGHRYTSPDGSADPLLPGNPSLMLLANQVFLKDQQLQSPGIMSVRGFFQDDAAQRSGADVILTPDRQPPGPFGRQMLEQFKASNLDAAMAMEDPLLSSFSLANNALARLTAVWPRAEFAQARLSPLARQAYRRYNLQGAQRAQFAALDIPTHALGLKPFLAENAQGAQAPLPEALAVALRGYQNQPGVVSLYRLLRTWPRYRFVRIEDPESLQSFIAVFAPSGGLHGVWNLTPLNVDQGRIVPLGSVTPDIVDQFVRNSNAWLIFDNGR